ncbi:MAG: septal ring lytic transglycosylase RlpA family protein [Candidatus Kapaibacteriota bacterium]
MQSHYCKIISILAIAYVITSCSSAIIFNSQTHPKSNATNKYVEIGLASYYSDSFTGKKTASGSIYNPNEMTAAHPSLPLGSLIKVTNLDNKREVVVIVNDRGPFVSGRIVDLSKAAAKALDFIEKGVIRVKIELIE